jgi:peptidoglycan/LPS O-acetylase OafA/YrhL
MTALLIVFLPLFLYSLWCWYLQQLGQLGGDHRGFHAYLGYWHMFMIGAILQWTFDRWTPTFLFGVSLAAIFALSAYQAIANPPSADIRGTAAAVAALSIFVAGRFNKWDKWLAGRAVQALGKISYSIYLVHVPICTAVFAVLVDKLGQGWLTAIVGTPVYLFLALGAAYLLNRFVEQPSIQLSHRFKTPRAAAKFKEAVAAVAGSHDADLRLGSMGRPAQWT